MGLQLYRVLVELVEIVEQGRGQVEFKRVGGQASGNVTAGFLYLQLNLGLLQNLVAFNNFLVFLHSFNLISDFGV